MIQIIQAYGYTLLLCFIMSLIVLTIVYIICTMIRKFKWYKKKFSPGKQTFSHKIRIDIPYLF